MTQWTRDEILRLARNFMEARVLLTAADLDLFTRIGEHPASAHDLAQGLGGDARALTMLLDALASMGLLTKAEGVYALSPAAAQYLTKNAPQSVLPLVKHQANLWNTWSTLTQKILGPNGRAPQEGDDALEAFIEAMHVIATPQADAIVASAGAAQATKLLDVGGGPGTYTAAFLRAIPTLHATLFDRPPVLEIAKRHLAEAGLLHRVRLAPGDFTVDPLPEGHDFAWVSAIIHQNGPQENIDLFRKVHAALVPGGRIIIRDHVMAPDRTAPRSGALFAINMLVGTREGGTYTLEEIRTWLETAGFTGVRSLREGTNMDSLVEAYRP
ncbi:MAG: methyltransferase [Chthonomonadales bacterium]